MFYIYNGDGNMLKLLLSRAIDVILCGCDLVVDEKDQLIGDLLLFQLAFCIAYCNEIC